MRKILCALLGLILTLPGFAACPSGQVEQTYTSATGTVTQNGTPTPTNPIEPVFYQQGNMVLRKVGDIADSYDATTGIITRRVGKYIVKGTEAWSNYAAGTRRYWFDITTKEPTASSTSVLCNKYHVVSHNGDSSDNWILNSKGSHSIIMKDSRYETPEDWKAYLADQYAAGTPVVVYYPLTEAKYTTEYVGTEWCKVIKIATTAYNSARFSPVVTELNDTIATIRDVVTNTINQTKAIADLQATKQTRPDEQCPAGKKCLLVEDDAGMPHWYEIIESVNRLPDGYTELQYIESTGTQYIDPDVSGDARWVITAQANAIKGSSQSLISSTPQASGGTWYGEFTTTRHWDIMSNGTNIPPTTKTTADLTFDSEGARGTIGSTSVDRVASVTQGTWRIFVPTGGSYPFAGKLFDAKVYQGGVLIRNFVPAKDSSNVIGMYDTVSGQFFTNQGTGTFVEGPEI